MNEWIHAAPDGTSLSLMLVARTAPAMYELSDCSFCLPEHMFGTVCKMLINAGKHDDISDVVAPERQRVLALQ